MKIHELGFIDKGTGKHQSNVVYGAGGCSPTLCAGLGIKYWTLIVEERRKDMDKIVCERRMDEGLRTFKDNVCGTIRTIDAGGGCKRVIEQNVDSNVGYRIRKLTPKECFRLMAFSDEAFDKAKAAGVSNSQLYKQAGNSIVVDVLYYIYKSLYKAMPYLFDNLRVSSFFSGIGAFEAAHNKLYEDINGKTNGEESFIISNVPLTFNIAEGATN